VAHAPLITPLLREATERGARSETVIDLRVVAPLQATRRRPGGPGGESWDYPRSRLQSGAPEDFFDRSTPLPGKRKASLRALIRAGMTARSRAL